MDYDRFRAMNSEIVLAAYGELRLAAQGFDQARAFIRDSEQRFTRFAETSELSALNRSSGQWFHASPDLYEVARLAIEYAEETGGLFDPTILGALESVGYDKSMDAIRAEGVSTRPRSAIPARSDDRSIEFDDLTRGLRLPSGLRIDLGGIAKGWIAEQAALRLAEYSEACVVNAGGDLFAVGWPNDGPAWTVGLEDPRRPERDLTTLYIGPGALATSSILKRRWQQGDRIRHHLIDPRSGLPAETDLLSVTVVAAHAVTAEVYAKALLIAGSREAASIGEQHPELIFVAVDSAGQVRGSARSKEILNVHFEYA
jgi:thiamine biosynthesis lipoprotein